MNEYEIERQPYLDTLNKLVRTIQFHTKKREAPIRHYDGNPRHVRKTIRHYDGREIRELVVFNVGMKDCSWGNCRMCGLSTTAETLTEDDVTAGLERITNLPQLERADSLYISPYSFFSDAEMSPEARQRVYGLVNVHPNIKYAVFMTRPNYLNEKKLDALRKSLTKQKVIVWMGAETANPVFAKYCIDKGYSWDDVERASELMQRFDVKTGIWVLQKPPFVSEREGIEDATKTMRKGLDNGYEIRLMPSEVMDFTVAKLLHEIGKYKPPSLWSVVEVLRQFSPEEHLRIDVSGPDFEQKWDVVPREIHSSEIVAFPANCVKCTDDVHKAITDYNDSKRIEVFDNLDCECRDEWQRELDKVVSPLEERLIGDFSDVITHFIEERR